MKLQARHSRVVCHCGKPLDRLVPIELDSGEVVIAPWKALHTVDRGGPFILPSGDTVRTAPTPDARKFGRKVATLDCEPWVVWHWRCGYGNCNATPSVRDDKLREAWEAARSAGRADVMFGIDV